MFRKEMKLKSIFCISVILLIVEAYGKADISNDMAYKNYRQYVDQMYQQDRFPQMPIYGQSFDNHGSYKYNPHVIPKCKIINSFICCETKHTYECHKKLPMDTPPTKATEIKTTPSISVFTPKPGTASVSTAKTITSTTSLITTIIQKVATKNNPAPGDV